MLSPYYYAASIILLVFLVHYAVSDYANVQSTTLSPDQVSIFINEVLGPDNCTCMPMNKCQKYQNKTINKLNVDNIYGEGLMDVRIGECPSSALDICCQETINENNPTKPPILRTNSCGRRHSDGVGFRIAPGKVGSRMDTKELTEFGEFNWMVAIMKKTEGSSGSLLNYKCGGSLIHPKVVLTAAHCVKGSITQPDEIILRAGEWDSLSESEILPYQQVEAEKIVVHKEYSSGSLHNNIALVFLKEPFTFAENVDVVCLPPRNENVDLQKCVACGWGQEKFDSETYSNILKRVDLPVVPSSDCQDRLRETKLGARFVLHQSFLCAGGIPGGGTCKGDGGGPLMCPIPGHPDKYYQVGIVSWGIGCGTTTPGIYASIPYLRTWIDEQFAENNLTEETWYYNYKE